MSLKIIMKLVLSPKSLWAPFIYFFRFYFESFVVLHCLSLTKGFSKNIKTRISTFQTRIQSLCASVFSSCEDKRWSESGFEPRSQVTQPDSFPKVSCNKEALSRWLTPISNTKLRLTLFGSYVWTLLFACECMCVCVCVCVWGCVCVKTINDTKIL